MTLVQELEKQLAEAKKAQQQIDREVWNGFKPQYTYTVYWRGRENDYQNKPFGSDPACLIVVREMTDESKKEYERRKVMSPAGPLFRVDETVNSVGYLRDEEGYLCSISGGWMILSSPVKITEEQWEQLKAGNVEPFLRKQD